MVLAMSRPSRRSDSAHFLFRKRVPADIQAKQAGGKVVFSFPPEMGSGEPIRVTGTIGTEVKVSLRTRDPEVAKARNGIAQAQFQAFCEGVRRGPETLTHAQVIALSGVWYRRWVDRLRDMPGSPAVWRKWVDLLDRAAAKGAVVREIGPIVDEFLAEERLTVDEDSRERLCDAIHKAMKQAGRLLHRFAEGDYRPDPDADRFPEWRGVRPKSAEADTPKGTLTLDDLFGRWKRESSPSASTITTWRSYIRSLKEHLGHDDVRRITKADVVAWKDALVAAGFASVRKGQLAAIKALFSYALQNNLITANPADGVTVRQKKKAGERMLPYDDTEVGRILALADKETNPAKRWLPWLMALSGARVGEVAQLWGQRITAVDGVPVMKIAPAEDGGSLKNEGSERTVPIHPAIIERGFLDFVKKRGDGPLFYGDRRQHVRAKPGEARRHASKGVANHLAAWVRENGFTDPRKAPSHAFRHWFKTRCQRLGILDSIADAIQGHASGQEADGYRHGPIATLDEAIRRIPVPEAPTRR